MGRLLRTKKGEPCLFLLNGTVVSVSTTRHQSAVRSAVQASSVPNVIIPFDTLDSAGIDYGSIELVEAIKDTFDTTEHRTYEQPEGSVWRDDPIYENIPFTEDEIAAYVAKKNADARESYEYGMKRAQEDPDGYYAKYPPPEPKVLTAEDVKGPTWSPLVHYGVVVGHERRLYWARSKYAQIDVSTEADTGRTVYTWTTSRHRLGEAVIRAKLRTEFTVKCRPCKGTGRKSGKVEQRTPGLARWEHDEVFEKGTCNECSGRGAKRRVGTRTAYFLSGFDHQETERVYFLCELPRGPKPTTVAEAYECLKPDVVKLAEQMGREVRRQGDIFGVELRDLTKRDLTKQGARFERRGNLLGTNHEATETAYLPNGTTLARGCFYHNPAGRPPDHKRITLGKHWHIVVKNTVPVTK
jgi:hypothetical protein